MTCGREIEREALAQQALGPGRRRRSDSRPSAPAPTSPARTGSPSGSASDRGERRRGAPSSVGGDHAKIGQRGAGRRSSSAATAASAAKAIAISVVGQAAEFDHGVAADQIVDRGGVDVDAGDRAALERPAPPGWLRQRATRRPRAVDARSRTASTSASGPRCRARVPKITTLPSNWRRK